MHNHQLVKLAAYLDEAHDDPLQAVGVIKQCGLHHIALRTAWGSQICHLKDSLISSLREEMVKNDVTPVILYSNLGDIDSTALKTVPTSDIERVMQVASYYKINHIRFGIGNQEHIPHSVGYRDDNSEIDAWLKRIQTLAISYGVAPLLEVRRNDLMIDRLKSHPKWRVLFDPAQFVISSATDVFDKYYKSLKPFLAAIELHDYKTGYGHKPVGFGNSKIKAIVDDCEEAKYNGWYILEHSLGRKYASYKSKHEVFAMSKQALDSIFEAQDD